MLNTYSVALERAKNNIYKFQPPYVKYARILSGR